MFPPQEHVWFIGFAFYTPCPTCAFLMPCSCIAHNHLIYTPLLALPCLGPYLVFISFPHSSWPFCLFVSKRGRVYSREYTGEFCYFYMTFMHILRGRNSISCAHLQGERYFIGEMHIPRGRRHCVNKKTLLCLCFLFAL